jgi:hypothetical protein
LLYKENRGICGYTPIHPPILFFGIKKIKIDRYIRLNHLYYTTMTDMLNGRNNQKQRGLSVNQENIRPKLTAEQRATMSDAEKKEYNAQRLKEYRQEYINLYSNEVMKKGRAEIRQEKKDAYIFYKQFKEQQAQIAV